MIWIPITAFVCGELIATPIFRVIRKLLDARYGTTESTPDMNQPQTEPALEIIKGVLERLLVFLGLYNGFPQVLIVFGALKIATRLHGENRRQITNYYFLIGNLTSLNIATTTVLVARWSAS